MFLLFAQNLVFMPFLVSDNVPIGYLRAKSLVEHENLYKIKGQCEEYPSSVKARQRITRAQAAEIFNAFLLLLALHAVSVAVAKCIPAQSSTPLLAEERGVFAINIV